MASNFGASGKGYTLENKEEGFFSKLYRNEIQNPQNRAGNLNILFNASVFGAAVFILKNFGDVFESDTTF
ncbi:hypothetical protein K502DRAFT_366402 [Neoconidiobolus thromboides FSU 785]|nr:hypothetical protein K502DRAFT_366402 [Neoconidiobolus thromboides FSU 785]